MKLKKFMTAALLFSMLFFLFSCLDKENTGTNSEVKKRSLHGFSTTGNLYDYSGGSEKEFEALADRVEAELLEYHKLYDIYNEYEGMTNLATLNKTAGTGAKKVDKKIIDLLLFSKEMYGETGGNVNVAFGAVLSIWHEYRNGGEGTELPPMDALISASAHTDINNLVINEENLTALKSIAKNNALYIWLPLKKLDWLEFEPADKAQVELSKKYGKVGLWIATEENDLDRCIELEADVVETDGALTMEML